jgi:hypothetical protein
MKLTIVPADNAVYKDNLCWAGLDLSTCGIPSDVHALQWYDTRGWIEFKEIDPFTPKPQNQDITELPAWAECCLEKWEEANIPPPAPEPELQPE